jgi:hypothetical protein
MGCLDICCRYLLVLRQVEAFLGMSDFPLLALRVLFLLTLCNTLDGLPTSM